VRISGFNWVYVQILLTVYILNNFSRNEKSLNDSMKSILFACSFNVDDLKILGAGFKSSLDYNIFETLCSLYFFLYSDGDKSNCFLNAVLKCF
jgi:hypothetical protein